MIDVRSREVRVSDRPVELSAKEYDLLVTLAGEPTRVFTRAELMRGVWGLQTFGHTRTLDSHASRLRRKLCGDGDDKLVINVWGVGYRLIDGELHRRKRRPRSDERRGRDAAERRRALPAARRRAGRRARAALARERTVEGLFAQSAAALEDAAGALLHAAATFIALDGPLPGLFAEQAGALLAVAARFEEAADLTRARAIRLKPKGGTNERTRDRELPRRGRRPPRARRPPDRRRRLARARHRRRGETAHVVDTLAGDQDGRPQAEAIARDYLTTVGAHEPGAGPAAGEPIPEQGGSDARSHRRPRPAPRQHRARGAALPRPAR